MASSLGVIFCWTVLAMFVQGRVLADSGSLTCCGGSKFTMSWSPAVLKADHTYLWKLFGQASVEFAKGKIHTSVWQDGKSIWDNTQELTCDKVVEKSPFVIKCQIKKGQIMDVINTYTVADIFSIIPPGKFVFFADIHNYDGEEFLCVNGTVTVAAP